MRAMSLRTYLIRLVWFCVLPPLLLAIFLAILNLNVAERQLDQEARKQLANATHAIDLLVRGHIDALQVLAGSPLLDDPPHLADFYVEAQAYFHHLRGNIILADQEHHMLLNTRVPFGQPLPSLFSPQGHAVAPQALDSGRPTVGDMFLGPLAQEPLVAVAVPVIRRGQAKYLLLSTVATRHLVRRLAQIALPESWSLALLDGKQEVMARAPAPGPATGPEAGQGHPWRFVAPSQLAPWSVVLQVPQQAYRAPVLAGLLALAAAILGISLLSVLGAWWASRRLLSSVASLLDTHAAAQAPETLIKEFEEVGAERRRADEEKALTAEILHLVNTASGRDALLKAVLTRLQEWSGCQAVGIRLRQGDDFPYFETSGFPASFVKLENSLCARDAQGDLLRGPDQNPIMECMCGNILQGRVDPAQPFFTNGGSFWSNCTTELLANTSEAQRQARTRNRCNGAGYESVALIPLRAGNQTFGLIQLNDHRRGCFTPEKIALLERLANSIAGFLAKAQAEEQLQQSEARLRLAQEAAEAGTWEWNLGTNENYWSEELWQLYGLKPHSCQPSYEAWLASIHPDDRQGAADAVSQAAAQGTELVSEWRVNTGGGKERWLLSRGRPQRDASGQVTGFIGIVLDISERKQAEAERERLFQQWRLALKAARMGWWRYDPATKVCTWDERYQEIFAMEGLEGPQEEILKRLHPEDLPRVGAAATAALDPADPQPYYVHYRINLPDGSQRWVESHGLAAFEGQGRERHAVSLVGSVADITERKRAERELQESEAHFRSLFQNMLNGYAYCRMLYEQGQPVDFIYLEVNNAFGQLTGLENVQGKRVSEIIPGIREADPKLLERYGRVASTGMPERFETYVTALDMWFSISVYRPHEDHFVAVFDVITERKLAEQELLRSQASIRGLLDATTDSILLLDRQYRVLAANQVASQRLGLTTQDIQGHSVFEFLPPEVTASRRASLDEVLRSGRPLRFKDQRQGLHFDNHIYPVTDKQGQVTGIAVYARDITQAMRDEAQRASLERQLHQAQKMEAIGTLAGGIAHDFNNILAAIMGYAEMAQDDARRGQTDPADLEEITKAAERAKALVRQILTFSRRVEAEKKPLDLNREVLQATQLMGKTIPKMIQIEADLDPDLAMVHANANQMEQVLLNLGTNAADAMPDGGKLCIKTQNIMANEVLCLTCGKTFSGPHVALTFSDSGQGIDPLILEHVFEPFYTTKGQGKGTGLGLSTVHGIVTSHGGHITCASAPGSGTTFTIYLPAVRPAEHDSPEFALAQPLPGGHETLLLADDEEALLRLGSRILTQAGYAVLQAATGEQAVEVYRQCEVKPQALVLDLGMPGMGGKRALEEILAINPQAKVIIASGYGTDGRVKAALGAGALGFVAKPYHKSELLNIVRSVLDKQP